MKLSKAERQQKLQKTVEENPFVTDETLASTFQVSVQTIRLDRMALSIPELRERIKHVARLQLDDVKALQEEEVIGDIVDLTLDEKAISILDVNREHTFSRTGIARGHHLFAQANSLAVAVINDELALTSTASVNFRRQVKEQERVIAKAQVTHVHAARTTVSVHSYVEEELVFSGEFLMYRSTRSEADQ
ncbi:transcription factor FapR [Salsuginibacillus kocurii]|uniref:transcription factor FapR n=1 Tax=Salsuginibacillus kocurii TaxID=427078 RepID=UPI0003730F48|nr:transcription factor FapR [Salsuginibacillus kocurii]